MILSLTMRSFLLAVFSFISFTPSSYGATEKSNSFACRQIYQPFIRQNHRPWHRPELEAIGDSHEPKYTPKGRVVEIAKELEPTNQCQSFECYLFSVINYINVYNKMKLGSRAALISEPFLVAHKFLEHIKEGLRFGVDDPRLIHDLEGGYSYEAFHLTRTVGLVPKRSWRPDVPFDQWDMTKIYRVLKKEVPLGHESLNKLAESHGWESEIVKDAHAELFDKLKQVILENSGPLPSEFQFGGRTYNPKEYEREFGLPRFTEMNIHVKEGEGLPDNYPQVLKQAITNEDGSYRVLDGNLNSLVLSAKKYIDIGLPIIIDLYWKEDGHSMLVVGYEEGSTGELVRLKVMNSWGTSFGNNGYAWYTIPDVWKNITGTYRFEPTESRNPESTLP